MSEKSLNKIIEDCKKFYEKYLTFNRSALKRYHPSLLKRVEENMGIDKILLDYKEIKNNGTNVWNYNNTCLFYSLLGNLKKEITNKFIDIDLKNSSSKTFLSIKNKDLTSIEEIKDFLNSYLNIEINFSTTKNGVIVSDKNNLFEYIFIILEDKYRSDSCNKSNYAAQKYRSDFNKILKSNKNTIVIEFYNNTVSTDQIKNFLSYGGINIYKKFNILAIDPPTSRNMGYCVMEFDLMNYKILDSGTKILNRTHYRGKSLKEIYTFVESIIKQYNCKYIVSESAFGFGDAQVRSLLNENVGIFNFIGEIYSVPFVTISPKQFKADILGDFEATKDTTIEWVKNQFSIERDIVEHEADAITISLAFLASRELINVPSKR